MHLCSFMRDGRERVGIKSDDDRVIDMTNAARVFPDILPALPDDMAALIGDADTLLPALEALVAACAASTTFETLSTDAITWLPPVPRPGKIVGVAMNNSASDARKISAPDHPMFFLKPPSALIGHRQPIVVRSYYGGVHPEPELAVVIGKQTHRIDPQSALEHVFGYTILNDVTGNVMRGEDMVHYYALYATAANPDDLERREQHLSYAARYKGADCFGPIGPWIATRASIPDPGMLRVRCLVGGEVIAEDSTRYLTYGVAEIIAFLSRFHTLEPGDIVSMGTAFRPAEGSKRSLHTADLQRRDGPVVVVIEGIGTLENPVERVEQELGTWRLPK